MGKTLRVGRFRRDAALAALFLGAFVVGTAGLVVGVLAKPVVVSCAMEE